MDKIELRSHLEQLHAELQHAESLDDNERELLKKLERDIRVILEKGDDADNQQLNGLGERLRDAIVKLEASHPKIALFARQLIDQLSVLGI